jgi:undecaprenyl diphosphate synthase
MLELDPTRLPRHVAVIMDGNGRWAEQRGLPRLYGHRVGKDSVRAVVETSRRLGIKYLSLYAFSTENWARPLREVDGLMALLRRYLASELGKMMQHQIRLRAVGSLRRLPPAVREALRSTVEATKRNTGMTVMLAVSYGGREEIARAARAIARRVERGELDPGRITARTVAKHLGTAGIPDPDLLDPYGRRDAYQQLLPLAARLHRDLRQQEHVAGVPRARVPPGARVLPAAPAPLRPRSRAARARTAPGRLLSARLERGGGPRGCAGAEDAAPHRRRRDPASG